MRVNVHPADDHGCGWYRLRFPAAVLAEQGYDVHIDPALRCVWGRGDDGDHVLDAIANEADVVVFQRPLKREMVEAMRALQRHGVAVVVEIDDDFETVSTSNPAWRMTHPRLHPTRNREWLRIACREADLVTVSTPALAARYGRHGRVEILPNLVPAAYLDVEVERTPVPALGWTGTPETHQGDLPVVGTAVADVLRQVRATFRAIGSAKTLEVLGVSGEVAPWVGLRDGYPETVATLDVGIVPLADSAFNRSKSWLKGLEYAALGVPFVASPLPEYARLHNLGAGMLAGRPREWRRNLAALLTDADRRQEWAARGRAAVRTLTYEERAEQWWSTWVAARLNRRQAA